MEELKESDRTQWHQLATEIFYTYINKPNGAIRIRKSGLKRIEEFLLGDASPFVFYEIQVRIGCRVVKGAVVYQMEKDSSTSLL